MIAFILGTLTAAAVIFGLAFLGFGLLALALSPKFWLVLFLISVAGNVRRLHRQRVHH